MQLEILQDRSIIIISGDDAVSLLQRLITNDLINNEFIYTIIINNSGKFLFDIFLYKTTNSGKQEIYIDIHSSYKDEFIKYINMYKLRSNVEISEPEEYIVTYSTSPVKDTDTDIIFSLQDPRYKLLGYRNLLKNSINNLNDLSSNTTNQLYQEDKYKFGIIDGNKDLIRNKSNVIHYHFDKLNAINYTKGCYIGQEVISRAKYQGNLRKSIFILSINEDIKFFDIIQDDDNFDIAIDIDNNLQKIGKICSYHNKKAIALIGTQYYNIVKKLNKIILLANNQSINISITSPKWLNG